MARTWCGAAISVALLLTMLPLPTLRAQAVADYNIAP